MNRFCFVLMTVVQMHLSISAYADSLWREDRFPRVSTVSMLNDNKAYKIGDIITIEISESLTVDRTSETSTDKSVSNKGSITEWLYPVAASQGFLSHEGELPSWEYGVDKDFEGKGSIKESDKITAHIAATIIDILPNGNLLIEGSREIQVANDLKRVVISGIIRKTDITAENTVSSTLIANSKIYYEGEGPLADNQRRGIFTWLRDLFSMF
ncbi:flagellar basal body L-ring protein FlgH [bacterium]|nr:flagellar basal body L-ring protein FlgH [bacterium]MCP5462128.1 flagellar basal body L-ring protein FlgH [bacterium]